MKRTQLRSRSRLRARPKPLAAAERKAAREFFLKVTKGARCIACGKTDREAREAGTRLQAHHCIDQQTLRKYGLAEFLWAPELGAALCGYPCHSRHTSATARVARSALPRAVEEFAAEHNLTHILERRYG